jgi:hypothetical protein
LSVCHGKGFTVSVSIHLIGEFRTMARVLWQVNLELWQVNLELWQWARGSGEGQPRRP